MDQGNQGPMLYFVVAGAPLSRHIHHGVELAQERAFQVAVIPTQAAEAWLDRDALAALGAPVIGRHRRPGTDKRLPKPEAIILAPGTFNTVNKLVAGIADTYPLSVLCEALAVRRRIVVVPFVSDSLAGHPAWPASLAVLRQAGVRFIDPRTGQADVIEPLRSGTGDAVADAFQWSWVFDNLERQAGLPSS